MLPLARLESVRIGDSQWKSSSLRKGICKKHDRNERVFPTTPSTFPQSVFPPTQANNDYVGAQIAFSPSTPRICAFDPTLAEMSMMALQLDSLSSTYQQ